MLQKFQKIKPKKYLHQNAAKKFQKIQKIKKKVSLKVFTSKCCKKVTKYNTTLTKDKLKQPTTSILRRCI